MVIEKLPADERVNVIGGIEKNYELLLKNIRNGQKIRFVEKGSREGVLWIRMFTKTN